ncbi:unnamed protein product [Ceratitis capitata]|uniref:(Mediterranean fruit fly) hypothetical protein n=1 Tax=Ceratitis capitata TaxID=7213 RepID=A0A811VB57_CERCA|nr:unnamed protein product [Ceratitis capitata]
MEMLKSTTIWESASRPLFVRSLVRGGENWARLHIDISYWTTSPDSGVYTQNRRRAYAEVRRMLHCSIHSHTTSSAICQTHNKGRLTEAPPRDLLLIAAAKVEPPATQQLFQQKYTIKTTPATTSRAQKTHNNTFLP